MTQWFRGINLDRVAKIDMIKRKSDEVPDDEFKHGPEYAFRSSKNKLIAIERMQYHERLYIAARAIVPAPPNSELVTVWRDDDDDEVYQAAQPIIAWALPDDPTAFSMPICPNGTTPGASVSISNSDRLIMYLWRTKASGSLYERNYTADIYPTIRYVIAEFERRWILNRNGIYHSNTKDIGTREMIERELQNEGVPAHE